MLRSKLAPVPAAAWNAKTGKRVTGEQTSLGKEALSLLTPLSGKDIYDAMAAQGMGPGLALGLLSFFGDSVNTYATKAKVRRQKLHRTR